MTFYMIMYNLSYFIFGFKHDTAKQKLILPYAAAVYFRYRKIVKPTYHFFEISSVLAQLMLEDEGHYFYLLDIRVCKL